MRRTAVLLFVFALLALLGRAEEPALNPTPPPADEGPRDVVTYSDGRVLEGKLFLRGPQTLKLFDLRRKTYVTIRFSDIARLDVDIEKQSMEKVWRFKEEGDPEKIYTGEEYPLHYYVTHVTLRNGSRFDTHLSAVLYLKKPDGKEERVFLLIKQKGDTTQNLDDLVYVKSVVFYDRRLEEGGAELLVRLTGPGTPVRALVLQHGANQTFHRRPERDGKSFLWRGLPPDRYDLFLVFKERICYFLSPLDGSAGGKKDGGGLAELPEKPLDEKSGARPAGLTEEEKKSLAEYISGADEFFDVKESMDFGGNPKSVRVLVRQVKIKDTSYQTKRKGITLWRFDLWFLHRLQREWKIDSRAFVYRAYLPEGDTSGLPVLVRDERLGGIDLEAGKRITLEYPSGGR